MKNIQKLVLVPIEKWEKLGIKEPVKEVSVKTVPLKDQAFQKKAISQVKNQQGQGMWKKNDDSSEISSIISDKE